MFMLVYIYIYIYAHTRIDGFKSLAMDLPNLS